MKCMSCGNLIPDGSTICPFCNSTLGPVEAPVAPVTPEAPVQTPVAPVAPQVDVMAEPVAQAPVMPEVAVTPVMPEAPVAPAMPEVAVAPVETTPEVVAAPAMMDAPVAPAMPEVPVQQTPVVPETPAAPVLPQDQGLVSAPVTPEVAPQATPIMPEPAPTTNMVAQGITPEVGFGGQKEASTAEPKKKGKGKLIAIIVVLLIVVIAAVVGVLFYTSQYKSAAKRLDAIVNTMFKDLATIKNEKIDLASGKYSAEVSLNANNETISGKLDGTYAYDIPNKVMDYTLNVTSLNMGEELFNEGALNLEMYLKNTRVYFLLQNFYDKYIYLDLGEDFYSNEEETLDIDYNKVVIAVREATKAGLKAAPNTQSFGDATIGGKSQKANIIEIELNEKVTKSMAKAFITSLANNEGFVKEVAKSSDTQEKEIKDGLLEIVKEMDKTSEEDEDDILFPEPKSTTKSKLTIYTAMFGEEFLGAVLETDVKYDKNDEHYDAEVYEDTNAKLEVYPDGKATIVTLTQNKKKLLEVRVEEDYEKTSTEEKNSLDLKITLKNDDQAVTINVKSQVTSDLQPKVPAVNTKESINATTLTEADIKAIYDKAADYGNFGMIVELLFGSLFEPSYTDPSLDYNDPYQDIYTDYEDDLYSDFEF